MIIFKHPLFDLGFRPFFLAASIFSVLLVAIWSSLYFFPKPVIAFNYYPSQIWHAHEMIFGYSIAIIAGFLLTAIANWTGQRTVNGLQLAVIVMVWALARILPLIAGVPGWLIAAIDVLFLPALMFYVAKPLLVTANRRNYFIIAMLGFFAVLNILLHLHLLGVIQINMSQLLQLALYMIITLITVMAGRVFPMFSQNGVKVKYQAKKFPLIEQVAIPSVILFMVVNVIFLQPLVLLISGLLVALIHLIRLIGWYNQQIWRVPLVWVLHVGYLFLVVGFVMSALTGYYPVLKYLAMHTFTIGTIGLLTLGMIARVSLGHTGRNINKPPKTVTFAFMCLILSAIVRIVSPMVFPEIYAQSIALSGILWVIAFILFLSSYTKYLLSPRQLS